MKSISITTLQEIAGSVGLKIIGTTDLTPLSRAEKSLKIWQEQGLAGQMNYMLRSTELLSSPMKLLPQGRSIICVAMNYSSAAVGRTPLGFGRVARYAWGLDYHKVIPQRLLALLTALEQSLSRSLQYRVFSDAVPLMERALGQRAGLGFIGKNTMLIRKRVGSFFFLAEILSDLIIEGSAAAAQESSCGICTRCKEACPTAALSSDYVLDAKRCISYLNIEKRGRLSMAEQIALGEWVFGCDLCQEVCPFNHLAQSGVSEPCCPEFEAKSGVGPFLDLKCVMQLQSEAQFKRRFGAYALMRAGRRGLLRNALIVAANTGAATLSADMLKIAEHDSCSDLRIQALSSLSRLREFLEQSEKQKLLQLLRNFKNAEDRDDSLQAELLLNSF